MKLTGVRVQNYRSIRDTGWFDIEEAKTILVGPNEAGKTAVLEALQRINAPDDIAGFDALRDYPRALLQRRHSIRPTRPRSHTCGIGQVQA